MSQLMPVVLMPDGAEACKPFSELRDEDIILFGGGSEAFKFALDMQAEIESEIEAAGGIDAWRKQQRAQVSTPSK